ncbi:hypothetical protein GEV29_00820 [Aeromicrobium sp. SMF47]|uniref:Uncharacterized protein n=1 Tax=Aeromicrobium yanjiei TaxID=2662028 RepID=A0A5Q2MFD6_9ACTN|nr:MULTISPECIES: hypothetical protein [Aeromicrobium]MRJ75071.1 hypothetical protein [Aeromicrobium yanjiei]MRK02873.1 hypothetical protein [Aeromicrobium sp. S22]QGG40443.1 hypothetical protein GEV26_03140 [Aeromicrobium yanjiei]
MTPDGTQVLGDVLLAHHVALLAIPAIVPAVVVVGVVLYIARKDRREEREERELIERALDPAENDDTDRP